MVSSEMPELSFSTEPEDYPLTTTPVKRRKVRDTMYADEFTYSAVHMDFDADKVFPEQAQHERRGDALFYQYPGKCPVMVRGGNVWRSETADRKEAQNQAFFVLSMLDSGGFVSGWRKNE